MLSVYLSNFLWYLVYVPYFHFVTNIHQMPNNIGTSLYKDRVIQNNKSIIFILVSQYSWISFSCWSQKQKIFYFMIIPSMQFLLFKYKKENPKNIRKMGLFFIFRRVLYWWLDFICPVASLDTHIAIVCVWHTSYDITVI